MSYFLTIYCLGICHWHTSQCCQSSTILFLLTSSVPLFKYFIQLCQCKILAIFIFLTFSVFLMHPPDTQACEKCFFLQPGLKSSFSAQPSKTVLRPDQCCLCLCWSSLGSGWSCDWNIPQGPKFCPICSHVDLQIFPPVWDFWHPKFPGCAYIIPVWRRTWLYGLECALCNWTSSLKNTPAILPVLVWGCEVCDVAL